LLDRFGIAGSAFWFYLSKVFVPHPLLTIYPRFEPSPLGFLAALLLIVVLLLKSKTAIGAKMLFCLSVFTIGLPPMLGLIETPFFRLSWVSDHWQYLSLFGIGIAAASIPLLWLARCTGVFCIFLSILSWHQAHYYISEELMWKHVAEYNPNSSFVWYSLGVCYDRRKEFANAESAYQNALARDPNDLLSLFNLGNIYLKSNLLTKAEPYFRRFIEIQPNYLPAYQALREILIRSGRQEEAKKL
jgi:hypothetical protein